MLLRNRNFSLLWFGQLVSQAGDRVYSIGLVWWLLHHTQSPLYVSSFLIVSMLPELLFSPLAGVYVDRWDRRMILVLTDIGRGVAIISLALLHQAQMLQIWHIYVAALFVSLNSALFNPATMSVIPAVVPKHDLHKANSLSQLVTGTVSVAGPLFGAYLVGLMGYTGVFWFNGITFLVSAAAESLLRFETRSVNLHEPMLRSMAKGLDFIQRQGLVKAILLVIALIHAFYGSLVVSLPFLARALSKDGIGTLSILQAAVGLGMIAASLTIKRRVRGAIDPKWMMAAVVLMGSGIVSLGLLGRLQVANLLPYAGASLTVGVGVSITTVLWRTTLQSTVPADMTGRVMSVCSATGNVSLPVSMAVCGMLLNHISETALILASGGLLTLTGLFLACRR